MPPSSRTKTSWYSDSDHRRDDRPAVDPNVLVETRDVSLRFLSYSDKQYSLKRAALDLLIRRASPPALQEFWALRNVSLRMAKGERIGVVGTNGAGKSTLLRLLARIYPPTSGQLTVRGNVAPLIEMGAGFNTELSGAENIRLNGAMLGYTRKEMDAKADGIFDFTGLSKFADLPLKYYSSGMFMRLAFAIATEIDPEILLIDESLGAGDAAFVDKAKARILKLFDRSHLVVIVSHDLAALREICTRGIWMKEGRVNDDGPIDEVIDRYVAEVTNTPAAPAPGGFDVPYQRGPEDEAADETSGPAALETACADPATPGATH